MKVMYFVFTINYFLLPFEVAVCDYCSHSLWQRLERKKCRAGFRHYQYKRSFVFAFLLPNPGNLQKQINVYCIMPLPQTLHSYRANSQHYCCRLRIQLPEPAMLYSHIFVFTLPTTISSLIPKGTPPLTSYYPGPTVRFKFSYGNHDVFSSYRRVLQTLRTSYLKKCIVNLSYRWKEHGWYP